MSAISVSLLGTFTANSDPAVATPNLMSISRAASRSDSALPDLQVQIADTNRRAIWRTAALLCWARNPP